jgi:3-hydroxyacyl-[acyl-carrier-protein] dehydratase
MRWFWIDRFTEFIRGTRAVAVKNIAMCEEEIDGYCPGFPVMPGSLMIEGMAQTAGMLVGEMGGFDQRVVLAKIGKAVFERPAVPGETLRYEAQIADVKRDGAFATVRAFVGDERVAEVELMFAFLDDRFPSGPLFEPVEFVAMLRAFHIYDVGRTPEGQPLELPKFYADAEREAQAQYEQGAVKVRSNGAP